MEARHTGGGTAGIAPPPARTVISAWRNTPCPISILLGVFLVSSSSRTVRFVGRVAGVTPAGGAGAAATSREFWFVPRRIGERSGFGVNDAAWGGGRGSGRGVGGKCSTFAAVV